MSWEAQAWVWTLPLQPTVKLLALSLANYASPTGKRIMPGHDRILAETGLSPASLKRSIAVLVDAGYLIVTVQAAGRGHRNVYEMPIDMVAVGSFHASKGVQSEPLYEDEDELVEAKGAQREPLKATKGAHSEPFTESKGAHPDPLHVSERGSNRRIKGLKSTNKGAHCEPPFPRDITLEVNPRVGSARGAPDPRGTRLPDGWVPGEAGFRFARERNLDPDETLAAFGDYWRSQPGAKGRKANWALTFQVWCRNEVKFSTRRGSTRSKSAREQWVDVKRSYGGFQPRFDA